MLNHAGENTIPYNEEIRLFLTTKMPNPHYLPEVAIKTTIINFTVTMEGLEDQLCVCSVLHTPSTRLVSSLRPFGPRRIDAVAATRP